MQTSIPGSKQGGYLYLDALVAIVLLSLFIAGFSGLILMGSGRVGKMEQRVEVLFEESLDAR